MKTENFTKLNIIFFLMFIMTSSVKIEYSSKINDIFTSFIETKTSTSIESNITTRKTRWTQDGRQCAKAFIQEGQTFNDCTKSKSPDGEMNNREWCYVETPQSGSKSWDYCKEIMDYDQVRKFNQDSQKEISKKVNELNEKIQDNLRPAEETLNGLKKLKTGQEDLFIKITEMFKSLDKMNKNLDKLYKTKSTWDSQKDLIKDLEFKIQKLKDKQLEEEDKEKESNGIVDNLMSKIKGHETILSSKKTQTFNCKGMMNYEDEEEGDGLLGRYYDNEVWTGSYLERKDPEIDFDWTDTSPMKGINPNNFSIQWEGFVYVPHTGEYNFIVKADDGVELIINNQYILRKKLKSNLDDDDESTNDIGTDFPTDPDRAISDPIFLEGGTKVKLALNYFHSIHNDLIEDGQTLMQMQWQSNEFPVTMLQKKYLYSTNDFPALKVTEFHHNDAILRKLSENDTAFKNSDSYIIQDIPPEFYGATLLKFDTLYTKDEINFHINAPSIVFIGFIQHYPNPLTPEFENTGLIMSMLQIEKKNNSKRVVATNSATLLIYKNKFAIGDVRIKLNKVGINKSGIPLILFFGFDSSSSVPLSCPGNLLNVSLSTGPYFKTCKTSSEKNLMNCEAAFSGKMRDEEGSMWATKNEGIGAWIEIEFKNLLEIRKFAYKNKKNPAERNKILELVFSNGRSQLVNIKNSDEIYEFKIEPVRTTKVKITIKDVYGTINNGGSFDFYGVECVEMGKDSSDINFIPNLPEFNEIKKEIQNYNKNYNFTPLFFRDNKKSIALDCRDSISNSNKFEGVSISPKSRIKILCPESCLTTDAPVYGGLNSHYSKDSAICKAAFHSGIITSKGGKALMVIKPAEENLRESTKNGIKTESRIWSSLVIQFEKLIEEDQIIIKEGSKVDLNLTENVFIKGTIREIKAKDKMNLTIQLENDQLITLEYPNKKILACGKHFKNRNCKGSLKNYISKTPIKIRFVTKDINLNGEFLPDYGDIYGSSGQPFGFSRDISHRVFNRGNLDKKELESFIQFPPSPLSKYCNKPNPETNCESVIWSVWAGQGKFRIKLFIGDTISETILDFTLNGKVIAKNLKIPKNKLEIINEVVESKFGFIHLTSVCKENCDYSMPKLNSVIIEPYEEINKDVEVIVDVENKLDCGMAYENGRCDSGPDVLHCVFNNENKPSSRFCSGEYSLVLIPTQYMCKNQIGKYKCVKINYKDEEECNKFCPKKCDESKCVY